MGKRNKMLAWLLSASMMMGALVTGCGSESTETGSEKNKVAEKVESTEQSTASTEATSSEPKEVRTIKILHNGAKPERWDAVYEEYLKRTKDTINVELDINWIENPEYKDKLNLEITSGGEWDLVFDAPFMLIKTLAAEGYYADLSEYFNNPEYPGLRYAFDPDVMEANSFYGQMCYIPLFQEYNNGIPCVWYRKDWANEWGVGNNGEIDSYEELEEYWQAAKDNGVIPLGAVRNRGFFQLYTYRALEFNGSVAAGIQKFSAGGLDFYAYIKDNELIDIATSGGGDGEFANFPEGYDYDFTITRYDKFEEYQKAGYIDPDALSCTDADTPFVAGLTGSIVTTVSQASFDKYAKAWGSEDAVGFFVYVDSIRNMEEAAMPTDRVGNNGLAVPASSKNIDAVIDFLDWMFASQENHDLIQMGIEGEDFQYEENGTFTLLSDYSTQLCGYTLTWNPKYVLLESSCKGEVLEYKQYEQDMSSFYSYPILGFNFNTSDSELSTLVAQVKAITDMIGMPKAHGIATDSNGTTYDSIEEMIETNTKQAMENGGQILEDALREQLEAYLAAK